MPTPEDTIESILGRKLKPEEEGSLPDLGKFPPHLLAEARKIFSESRSCLLTFRFIKFYVGPGQVGDVKLFIEDVVAGGEEPATWRHGYRYYLPAGEFPRMLGLTVSEALAPLRHAPGERWFRVMPFRSLWSGSGESSPPFVLQPGNEEEWHPPEGAICESWGGREYLERIDDVDVAMRRWMASRVAWQLTHQGVTLPADATVADVMTALSVDVPCSVDAEIAIRGLLREDRELGPSSDAVPGFRGPDEWFTA
jgi:hypothetical protein